MSYNGRGGRGGFRGGDRGGFRGGRGGDRGGFRGRGGGRGGRGGFGGRYEDQGPPETVMVLGDFMQPCEDDAICKCTNEKVPYFNAPIFLENKQQIGKVDEIFGPIRDYYCSIKLSEGIKAKSFNDDTKFYIDPYKLLPLERFTGEGQRRGGGPMRGGRGGGRGRGGGGFRGGRGGGGFRGGRGGGGRGGGFRGGRGGGRGGGGFRR